jgi:hypothetical protein
MTGKALATGKTLAVLSPLLCTAALAGCGDTLQDQPIGLSSLESVIVKSRFPVYWAGLRFAGMRITGVTIDPGGAVTISYGDCLVGGQYTCVTPLSIVTSPDNSFLPAGGDGARQAAIRGLSATATRAATTLALRTGGVVVSVYTQRASLARAAADTMVPLNKDGLPGSVLPAPHPDTGFDRVPLPSQLPPGATVPREPS